MDFSEAYNDTCSSVGIAARIGDLVLLQNLVWQGKDCDIRDNRGWTALHEAAFHQNSGCLEFLLRQDDTDVNWTTFEGETPLLLAARAGHLQGLRLTVNSGASINHQTNELYTPLWEAVQANSLECVRYLLRHGADINHEVYTGYTPLHLAAEKGYHPIVELLLSRKAALDAEADDKLTPVFLAAQFGQTECLESLLKCAKERGQLSVVDKPTSDKATPIVIAAQEGHEDCVKLLLAYHASPNIPVQDYFAVAAHFAIYKNHPECLKLLLPVTDSESLTDVVAYMHPLVLAAQVDSIECLELILNHGIDMCTKFPLDVQGLVETLGYSSKASLLCQVGYSWSLNAIKFLLDRGLPCDAEIPDELPPLLGCLLSDQKSDLFTILLGYGANPNIYRQSADGNVMTLRTICWDLRCLTTLEIDGKNKREIYGRELSKLVLIGADIKSCIESLPDNPNPSRYNLFTVLDNCSMVVNLWPVLTILFAFCNNLYIHQEFKKMVYTDEVYNYFNKIEESTRTLAHQCRQSVVKNLAKRHKYKEDCVRSLPIPTILQDFLLFLEYGVSASNVITDSLTCASLSFYTNEVNFPDQDKQ